jgi:hypothetical protein
MRIAFAVAAILALAGSGPATAGIASATASGSFSSFVLGSSGLTAFSPDPDYISFLVLPGPGPGGLMSMSFSNFEPNAFLVRPAGAPAPPSGYPFVFAPFGSIGDVGLVGTMTATYTLDSAGLGPTVLDPISHDIFWVGSASVNEYHETISYSSADFGALGTRILDWTPPPGSTGLLPVTGPFGLTLPAFNGFDTITVTATFDLKTNAFGGTSSEIKVSADDPVPEPSAVTLLLAGLVLIALRFVRLGHIRGTSGSSRWNHP